MNSPSLPRTLTGWWRWAPGRQGTGYAKLLLATARWPIGFDLYVLRYRPGQGVPPHTDPVPGMRHFRFNITFARGVVGGRFVCKGPCRRWGPAVLFRPDLVVHQVDPVVRGTRYVVSLGWVCPELPAQGR